MPADSGYDRGTNTYSGGGNCPYQRYFRGHRRYNWIGNAVVSTSRSRPPVSYPQVTGVLGQIYRVLVENVALE